MATPLQRVAAASEASGTLRTLLREWRARRHVSQLALALEAGVSQRHLSFVESGRARPSRDLVLRLAQTLDLPLRARNELLMAAQFAPAYPERALDAGDMRVVRGALERIMTHHEPYPAMVLDRYWNIVMRNAANVRLVSRLADTDAIARRSPDGKLNFVRMMFAADGIRRHVANWDVVSTSLIARVRREANVSSGSPSSGLLEELLASESRAAHSHFDDALLSPTAPLELDIEGHRLRLINMLTTFGTPQDVAVQELRIEMAFPADEATRGVLVGWARDAG
jgi:transcriptional regulator with XRE-family HTH domain